MKFLLALTIVVWSPFSAMAAQCGAGKTVGKVVIRFDCDRDDAARIHWFTPKGHYKDAFDGVEGVVFDWRRWGPAFDPSVIPMTFEGGGECVAGDRKLEQGNCVATYNLPCAARSYALTVDTKSANTQVRIDRSIRRKNATGRCDIPWKPTEVVSRFSEADRVTVTVFQLKPALALFQTVLNIGQIEGNGFYETFVRNQPQIEPQRGQGSGAVSENARWLIDKKHLNVPETIDLRVVRETP